MDAAGLWRTVFVLGFMAFWVQGDNYAAAPLIVQIAKDLGLSISEAALSVTSYMLPFGLFTLFFGPLADRYGKAKVINLAAFVTAAFSALGAAAFDLASLSFVRAVNGAFAAAIIPVTMSLIGDVFGHDPKAAEKALGRVFGLMFLGGASATAIGGLLAFLGSWRLVYLVYGMAELVLAVVMLRTISRQKGTTSDLNFTVAYKDALSNRNLMATVGIVPLIGFSVFGSFTYAGKYIELSTGYNILLVGLLLTCFGLGTLWAGRSTSAWRQRMGNKAILIAGVVGALCWASLGLWPSPVPMGISLAGFGVAFMAVHPVLVATAQQLMPQRRGTVMSLVSFSLFLSGGLGTLVYGQVIGNWGYRPVFTSAAVLLVVAASLAAMLLDRLATHQVLTQQRTGREVS